MNPSDADREPSPSSPAKSNRRRWVAVVVALLLIAASLWFLMPNPAPTPEAIVLSANYSIKSPPMPVPDRWIPMTWGWLWRARYAVLGKPAVIEINSNIVRLAKPENPSLSAALSSCESLSESNGVRAWILPESKLRAFHQLLKGIEGYEVIASPRIISGHTVQANMLLTTTVAIGDAQHPVGVFFNCLTRAHGKSADLTVAITHSEAVAESPATGASAVLANATRIHTNLHLAAKLQIPPSHGAFLLDANHADPAGRRVGIFVNAKVK